ncbi:hypothetical protein ACIQPQ_34500 [Streptomyces sp. NPDC091281]|uniref:hypothetical protein n=1 Tax=Streptomyces sp. NPDC091281 TaxID=3365985 RepID=UPI00380557F5
MTGALPPEREHQIRASVPTGYEPPWTVEPADDGTWRVLYATDHPEAGLVATLPDYGLALADFTAAARAAVPELLAEIDRLRADPLVVSRYDVAIEPALEEEPVLMVGAVAEEGRPVALLFDPEARDRIAGWLSPGDSTTDFFRARRTYRRGRWQFQCLAVAHAPWDGQIRAVGYLSHPTAGGSVTGFGIEDWAHGTWHETTDGGS